jgi:hypothetical protein
MLIVLYSIASFWRLGYDDIGAWVRGKGKSMTTFFYCHALPLAERRADRYTTSEEEVFEFDIFTFLILKKSRVRVN